MLVSAGLYTVFHAKLANPAEIEAGLASKKLLNLNDLSAREELLPALTMFSEPAERDLVARKIYYVSGGLSNVGAIGRIRITGEDVRGARGLKGYRDRLQVRDSVTLLTGEQLRQLKPLFVVRSPGAASGGRSCCGRCCFLAVFLLVHAWWSLRGFRGDQYLLPAVMLLSGAGLILMVSAARPGARQLCCSSISPRASVVGCVLLAAAAWLDYERLLRQAELRAAAGQLRAFRRADPVRQRPGHQRRQGQSARLPAGGDHPPAAGPLPGRIFRQPLGRAAARARNAAPRWRKLTSRFDIPPVEYTLPALVCVALSLVFFFLQKDMGPALVFACLFLVLYGMARGSVLVPAVGLTLVGCRLPLRAM